MSGFTTKLDVEITDDGRRALLHSDLVYIGPDGRGFSVPAGYLTDFATIPRPFWVFLPPWGNYGRAAILHDWLISCHIVPRKLADRIFFEAMTTTGVNPLVRWIMFIAVRSFAVATGRKLSPNTRA